MAKHQQVKEALVESIRVGEFPPESRLPSERDLAEQFGVSYLTARRAVADLVDLNLVERRARSGTFVRLHSHSRLAKTTVHLVCMAEDRTLNRSFVRIGGGKVAEHGWQSHVIRLNPGDDRAAIRALDDGGLGIFLFEGVDRLEQYTTLLEAMRRSQGRAVLLANRMDHLGIPSVLADDTHALRMAVHYLQENGHRQIALLTGTSDHPVARVQIAAWRAFCGADASPETLRERIIEIETSSYDCLPTATHDAVLEFLQSPRSKDVTAMISLVDEMALPALAACRAVNRPVPEAFAMLGLGNTPLLAYTNPPITCVDVDLEQHLDIALELLDAAERGEHDSKDRLRLVEPRLVIRQSVQPLL